MRAGSAFVFAGEYVARWTASKCDRARTIKSSFASSQRRWWKGAVSAGGFGEKVTGGRGVGGPCQLAGGREWACKWPKATGGEWRQ